MFIFEKAPFPSCHASTLVELGPGKLLAAWFGGKDEGAKDVKIWAARFDGQRWSDLFVLAEEPGQPCWNPVLFRAARGTVWFWYKAGPSPMTWTGFVRKSFDGGANWSPPTLLPAGLLGPIRSKPIQLADGTMLAGSSVESHRAWCGWVERSADGGTTWTRHGPLAVADHPYGVIQPTLFEHGGKVIALLRSRGLGAICRAESADDGFTWSPVKATKFPNSNSGFDTAVSQAGDVYLLSNPVKVGRFPLHLDRSRDGGATWQTVAKLESEAGEFSYPALIVGGDGRLHATYTWNRKHIKYRSFTAKELGA